MQVSQTKIINKNGGELEKTSNLDFFGFSCGTNFHWNHCYGSLSDKNGRMAR